VNEAFRAMKAGEVARAVLRFEFVRQQHRPSFVGALRADQV
jgi:hypothetical protein